MLMPVPRLPPHWECHPLQEKHEAPQDPGHRHGQLAWETSGKGTGQVSGSPAHPETSDLTPPPAPGQWFSKWALGSPSA